MPRIFDNIDAKLVDALNATSRIKIVDIRTLIRAFASMFLDEPHTAGRYPGTLLKESGQRMFVDGHKCEPYYVSAYAFFRMEQHFRKKIIPGEYRKFKHYILMILRYQICGSKSAPDFSSKGMVSYSSKILEILWDDAKVKKQLEKTIEFINATSTSGSKIGRDELRSLRFKKKIIDALR